jgi:hypothetical protein
VQRGHGLDGFGDLVDIESVGLGYTGRRKVHCGEEEGGAVTWSNNVIADGRGIRHGVVGLRRHAEVMRGERLYRAVGVVEDGDPSSTDTTVLRRGAGQVGAGPLRNPRPRRIRPRLNKDVE